jgi:hypothetical protein
MKTYQLIYSDADETFAAHLRNHLKPDLGFREAMPGETADVPIFIASVDGMNVCYHSGFEVDDRMLVVLYRAFAPCGRLGLGWDIHTHTFYRPQSARGPLFWPRNGRPYASEPGAMADLVATLRQS